MNLFGGRGVSEGGRGEGWRGRDNEFVVSLV